MSKLTVYDMNGATVGDLDVADGLLERERGAQAAHDVVVATMAARRAGTASTLCKGEVAGSNRKPWRQKGTGRARAGYRQSPVWRGGGAVFGPKPREYGGKVNRRAVRLAFRRAFSDRMAAGQVKVVDALTMAEPKTRAFAALMKALSVSAPALFVTADADRGVVLAARNLPGVEVVRACDLNVYQLLRYPAIVLSRGAADVVVARLSVAGGGR